MAVRIVLIIACRSVIVIRLLAESLTRGRVSTLAICCSKLSLAGWAFLSFSGFFVGGGLLNSLARFFRTAANSSGGLGFRVGFAFANLLGACGLTSGLSTGFGWVFGLGLGLG